ncbi:MAG: saccharopine dehydrogenase NADP-binding domain-containing protein [Bradymonadales bacterium]|nr:saccharopine dehydrogenase NADP-binding domain-containing protein [Bradymonadales bacterium]
MKFIVLGGAGEMGSRAVEDLVCAPVASRVTIADRNGEQAGRIAADLAGQGAEVEVRVVDATRHEELVGAIRGHDVVASALGPFDRFEPLLVRAAIEAGVSYASICDEWEPARRVIERFDQAARERGVTVVTGLGTSPGYTNVCIRLLADRLDRVHRVEVAVLQPLDGGGGPAVIDHAMTIMNGPISVWQEGSRQSLPALSDARRVEFPRFGAVKVWRMGHSEPETIPRFLPDVEAVDFFMGYGRGAWMLIFPARLGLFGGKRRKALTRRILGRIERFVRADTPIPGAVRVDVWGARNGVEQHHLLCGTGEMRHVTGTSLAVGALMLAEKKLLVEPGGVFAPEACLEPKAFIAAMRERGIVAYEDLEMTRELA